MSMGGWCPTHDDAPVRQGRTGAWRSLRGGPNAVQPCSTALARFTAASSAVPIRCCSDRDIREVGSATLKASRAGARFGSNEPHRRVVEQPEMDNLTQLLVQLR